MEAEDKDHSFEKEDASQNDHADEQTTVSFIGGDDVDGDKITVGDSTDSAVAVGRDARASIFNIDIRLLPLVVVLLIVVGVLAYYQLRPDPKPQEMNAEFNIAIAEFMVKDEEGNQIQSEEGKNFADWLYGRLDKGLKDVLTDLFEGTYLVWPPEYTELISGDTPEDREKAAEARAEEIKADVIIYGAIEPRGGKNRTSIEFYVNHASFEEGADIKGGHRLGDSIAISNPFDKSLVGVENFPLSARAEGLSLLAVGLAYYSVDEFEQAIDYFTQANSLEHWANNKRTGKHVLKLLLGNAYVRQVSKEKSPELLPTAQAYYSESLQMDEQYARAAVGLAGVDYLLAFNDPEDPDIDFDLLEQSERGFEEALTLENRPTSANIPSKVDLGLGQIYLLRYSLEGGDLLDKAVERFEAIIDEYEGGNKQIEDLAAHSYARMGLIEEKLHDQQQKAIDYYKTAAELASPFYKGEYYAHLGELYEATCQLEAAEEAYMAALDAASSIANDEKINEYADKLDLLANSTACP